jgi:hypothetical protein
MTLRGWRETDPEDAAMEDPPGIGLAASRIKVPAFDFPWPGGCHPDAAGIEARMIKWGARHSLIPTADYHARVARTRYGFLAARCYPRARPALVQAIADYFLWFFLADDLFVDRVETVTAATITNLTAMIDVLDYPRRRASPVYGESAWLDICQRLRACLSREHFERFAAGMRMWASTAGLQIINHLQARPIDISVYETIRRHTGGMNPCLALSDAANAGPVTPDEYHQPDVQALRAHASNIVCWSNDIQSLAIEARQPGQFRNMVTIYASQGHNLQEAVDITARRVRSEISSFTHLSRQVESRATPALRGYITGMRDWMHGYQDWFDHDTERYATVHADRDADDRGIGGAVT